MAADRQRLAQALAAEAARRKMFESIPEAARQGLPQAPEATNYGRDLENLSIGLGRGAVNQLEGLKGLVTSPVESLKGMATGAMETVRNPRMIAEALKRQGERAISGPLGLGEVIGENVNMVRMPGKPVMSELDVYHGTPHRFPATEANPLGEFDASKIGTGEGAQAYGHGVYLAESPGVAKSYADKLGNIPNPVIKIDAGLSERGAKFAENALKSWNYEPNKAVKALFEAKQKMTSVEAREAASEAISAIKHGRAKAILERDYPQGHLYKADLPDEMIDRMLDWDKPLSEQPEKVITALTSGRAKLSAEMLAKISQTYGATTNGNRFGQGLQDFLMSEYNSIKTPVDVSEWLRKRGIPGIKYADAGSRGAGGTGTRNFVVFPGEEKKVRILERK